MEEFLIPIRNKNGIAAYSKVDEDASKAYNKKATELYGEFASVNQI